MTLIAGTEKRIYVAKEALRRNLEQGSKEATVVVWCDGVIHRAHAARINGASETVYKEDGWNGKHAWVVTWAAVTLD